jgi:Icc-related predicted phosphoesterase
VLLVGLVALACGSLPEPKHRPISAAPAGAPSSIVVLGDTQRSLWAEEHVLGREQNETDRVALIDQLAEEENPALVVLLGDLVAASSPRHWEYFTALTKPLAERAVPLLAVLGNHEYFGPGRDPTKLARRRFPELAAGGYYAKRLGRLGLVFLDSNLSGRAAERQSDWLDRTLTLLDRDPGVRAILLFAHHPPYTTGVARAGTPLVSEELLPRLVRAKKGLALFAAHVHGYERYSLEQGRAVVITGGGGGPRVRYRVGARPLAGPKPESPLPRPLHYVVLEDEGAALRVTARCLRTEPSCKSGVLDDVSLPLP